MKRQLIKPNDNAEWTEGLPPGFSPQFLERGNHKINEKQLKRAKFKHLSGWKEAGAYRIEIPLSRGNKWRLVFKDANYHTDQLPALKGLPYIPGPPEYALFHHPPQALSAFLPQCLWAEETEPGKRYRYLFEDLTGEFGRIRGDEGLLKAVHMLLPLQNALQDWQPGSDDNLLHYSGASVRALEEYVFHSISRYCEQYPGDTVTDFLHRWPEILKVHELFERIPAFDSTVVHGDLNTTNIYVHKEDPSIFRLVDWEWAGWGNPHLDLACLLKRVSPEFEEKALQVYAQDRPATTLFEHQFAYHWHQLDRGLLDASYVAAQILDNPYRPDWDIVGFMEDSLSEVIRRTQILLSLSG